MYKIYTPLRFSEASHSRLRPSEFLTSALFIIVFLFSFTHQAHAGAWVQPKGQTLLIANATYYTTREAFDGAGRRVASPRFSKYELNPYGEYGLSEDLTLGFSTFLHYLEQEQTPHGEVDNNIGLGETELFVRAKLYEADGFALSLQPLVKLPSHYRHDAPIAGRANWDGELSVLGGYGFDALGLHHYLDLKMGYRYRSGMLDNQMRASAALGVGMSESLTLLAEMEWRGRSQGGSTPIFSVSGQNDNELQKAQLSLIYRIDDRYSLQLGGFRHINGEDTGAGGGALLALWTRW